MVASTPAGRNVLNQISEYNKIAEIRRRQEAKFDQEAEREAAAIKGHRSMTLGKRTF